MIQNESKDGLVVVTATTKSVKKWLGCWAPNSGVPDSKLLDNSKVNSVLHPSEVDYMSTRNFWGLSG